MQADPALATSAQDTQAQTEGDETATEQAAGDAGGADKASEIERAKAALAAGDEAACVEAVDQAKSM